MRSKILNGVLTEERNNTQPGGEGIKMRNKILNEILTEERNNEA